MTNKGSLVFEQIAIDLYVMIANRYGDIDCATYSFSDFNDLKQMGYTIEIKDRVTI